MKKLKLKLDRMVSNANLSEYLLERKDKIREKLDLVLDLDETLICTTEQKYFVQNNLSALLESQFPGGSEKLLSFSFSKEDNPSSKVNMFLIERPGLKHFLA